MEIAEDDAASGGCRIRDLPPSKRFKFVGSSCLGSAPCPPLPETAPFPVCLPAKKRAYAPAVAEDALKACLPAKKRAYQPPLDDIVPACLPAKKRVYVPPPPPLEDAAARPSVSAKKRVHPLLPPGGAAAAPSSPAKKHVHVPLPPLLEHAAVSPTIPGKVKNRVQPLLPPGGATAAPSAPAKKRVHVLLPPPPADAVAFSSIPAKKKVHPLMPPEAIAAPLSIPAKKRAQTPSPAEDDFGLAPVCLQANKRVMLPFICPSPSPSVESDGARVPAVKQARSQRSVKRGGGTDPRAAKGAVDCTRAEAFEMSEKPIKPKVQEQVSIKSCRASTAKESSDLHRKKLCDVVNGGQSEVEAEGLEKFDQVIDRVEAPAREEEPNKEAEEVAPERKQEAPGEEDGVLCAVCGSTDGDPSDPIVFCDGCDLMVHASCYGSPLAQSIPDGDWFCLLCSDKATATVKKGGKPPRPHCRLCPARGGAMKRTTDGAWAHIACALLVPEVFFQDPDGRDGIDCSRVPGHRYTKRCYICESSRGCALECSQPKCGLGFHVSCGLKGGLCIEYREEKAGAVVAGFCREHTKLWEKQQPTGKYRIVSRGKE